LGHLLVFWNCVYVEDSVRSLDSKYDACWNVLKINDRIAQCMVNRHEWAWKK